MLGTVAVHATMSSYAKWMGIFRPSRPLFQQLRHHALGSDLVLSFSQMGGPVAQLLLTHEPSPKTAHTCVRSL